MSNLINAIQQNQSAQAYTANGAVTNETSFSDCVDLFSIIGASRGKDITALFDKALNEDAEVAIRVAMWARDVRGGAGERKTFRDLLKYLVMKDAEVAICLIPIIPKIGRYDDLWAAYGIDKKFDIEVLKFIKSVLNGVE